ncbi:MAG: permease-like cell division protein FtsX [Clostridia bacterium]|nr:permease-like cell division protein FtsX [Clostridia bacterium]
MKYYIKSAASSFKRNGIMTIASFITVTCCLFLFGVFVIFSMNMNYIGKQLEQQCELQAYMYLETDEPQQRAVYEKVLQLDNVYDATLETERQAFENFKKQLGEDGDLLDGLEDKDFLRSSIKITLHDIRKSNDTKKAVEKISGIEKVENYQDTVGKVLSLTGAVNKGSTVGMIVLMIIAVFIIQNTIKLSVFAREKEIHIMKFVGATDRFIRTPFVIEGIMIGALGFIVSYAVILFSYTPAISTVKDLIKMFDFLPLQSCALQLGVMMALFGTMMGAIGSAVSIKRHLKV